MPRPAPLPADELAHALHACLGATVSLVDRDWLFRYVNEGFARALKMSPKAAIGRHVEALYGTDTFQFIKPLAERAMAGETVTYERRGRIFEDESAWISVTFSPWRGQDGSIRGFVTATLRVHELRLAAERLHLATERLAQHVDNSPLTVLELDSDMRITRASQRAQGMLGHAPEALVGKTLPELLSNAACQTTVTGANPHAANLLGAVERLQQQSETRNRAETAFTRPDGSIAHLGWFNSALASAEDGAITFLCLIEDITAERTAEAQLRHMATHDALTELLNRKGFANRMAQPHAPNGSVAVLYVDLDGFKEANDRYGHACGDAVLVDVAARLRALSMPHDAIARMGGDEFVVLREGATENDALALGNAIVLALREPMRSPQNEQTVEAQIRASVGVAHATRWPEPAYTLVTRADAAMYAAKRAGKDCVKLS
jgi:diguanylate cyclase (GGDEF)-like protein/PAS domain S-box-containing protein